MPSISFRVSEGEAERVRESARRAGLTISEFMRRRAVSAVAGDPASNYRTARDPLTGLPVMEAPPGMVLVSSEQIRALTDDFPGWPLARVVPPAAPESGPFPGRGAFRSEMPRLNVPLSKAILDGRSEGT